MAARRTQIYLTAEQRARLDERTKRTGESLAQIVREALECYLAETKNADQRAAFEKFFGSMPKLKIPSRRDEWAHRV